jgi:S-disulfanyl-L-cysteine oxidoreductase SoxD
MSRFPERLATSAIVALALATLPAGAEEANPFDLAVFEAGAFDTSGIGREATEEEIAGWDIDIFYDGDNAPEGSGTALEGEDLYVQLCASCHGDFGEGAGRWPELTGGEGTLPSEHPVKTVGSYWPYAGTLLDYTYRAMPYGFGQSLTPDELYAISAYILYLNDVIDADFELSHETLRDVRMPNEDGFYPDDREETEAHFWQDEPCMENCLDGEAEIVMRATILDVTPDGNGGGATAID